MHFNALRSRFRTVLDSGISIELLSAPGRGKSEFVRDFVREQSEIDGEEWGMTTLMLATQNPTDLGGLQFKAERVWEDGTKVAVSDPTLPLWMITNTGKPAHMYKRGVLFLDEFGQAEADTKRAAAELLLNRRVGKWQLPDGWSVVAASNRASDRSGVTKNFDFVINRRIAIDITDDLASWEDWAWKVGLHPSFIAFGKSNPETVFQDGVPDKQRPWCTPRSLVMLERLFTRMLGAHGQLPTDEVAVELASGLIGAGEAAQFMAHVKLGNEMPSVEEIKADPKGCKVPTAPDGQMLVCYTLAAAVTEKDVDPIITYVERMPKEFTVTFAKAACRRNTKLVTTRAFSDWAMRNASLMAAIVDRH
jgi:hypothetical protein